MRLASAVLVLLLSGCTMPEVPADPDEPLPSPSSSEPSAWPTSSGPSPTQDEDGEQQDGPDSALMVRLHRWVWVNRTSGEQRPYGDFGHHCSGGNWTEDPPSVVVYDWSYAGTPTGGPTGTTGAGTATGSPEGGAWPASGILVATYEPQEQQQFYSTGGSPSIGGFEAGDGINAVRAVFYQRGTLANLTAAGGELAVDGEILAMGAPVLVDRHYAFSSGGSSYEAHERLRFTLLGDAEVTVQNQGRPCI